MLKKLKKVMFFLLKAMPSQCGIVALLCLICAGCAIHDGRASVARLAEQGGFTPLRLADGPYVLQGWIRPGAGDTVRIYIEGDGFAWRTRTEPSSDPTPRNPMGLLLAASDPSRAPVAYVGRPCQYVQGADRRNCEQAVWTSSRYGAKVLDSLNAAVDALKARTGASLVMLCGYSGGGTLAALLAERRDDVVFWATVAGNLEVEAWTRHHRITPLKNSLDPAADKQKTADIPQIHVVGGRDNVIPPLFARSWCQGLPRCQVIEEPGLSHGGPWNTLWPGIVSGAFPGE